MSKPTVANPVWMDSERARPDYYFDHPQEGDPTFPARGVDPNLRFSRRLENRQNRQCHCDNPAAFMYIQAYCASYSELYDHGYFFKRIKDCWVFDEDYTNRKHKAPRRRRWLPIYLDANPEAHLWCCKCGGLKGTVKDLVKDGDEWRGVER